MSYSNAFFLNHAEGSRRSADRIAGIVTDKLHPTSVVDFGCGVGTWLSAFRDLGATDIQGFDGDYVNRDLLQIPPGAFRPVDFNSVLCVKPWWPDRRYDLAVSLEVGEHLLPQNSAALVQRLTEMAPAVLFSAAIPRQSGTGHINERWQSDWATMFAAHGYYPHDVIRPMVWNDPAVEPWYAQNVLLYLQEPAEAVQVLDLVHPRLWEKNLRNATIRARLERALKKMYYAAIGVARRPTGQSAPSSHT
jgi:hypothetical protein